MRLEPGDNDLNEQQVMVIGDKGLRPTAACIIYELGRCSGLICSVYVRRSADAYGHAPREERAVGKIEVPPVSCRGIHRRKTVSPVADAVTGVDCTGPFSRSGGHFLPGHLRVSSRARHYQPAVIAAHGNS